MPIGLHVPRFWRCIAVVYLFLQKTIGPIQNSAIEKLVYRPHGTAVVFKQGNTIQNFLDSVISQPIRRRRGWLGGVSKRNQIN